MENLPIALIAFIAFLFEATISACFVCFCCRFIMSFCIKGNMQVAEVAVVEGLDPTASDMPMGSQVNGAESTRSRLAVWLAGLTGLGLAF